MLAANVFCLDRIYYRLSPRLQKYFQKVLCFCYHFHCIPMIVVYFSLSDRNGLHYLKCRLGFLLPSIRLVSILSVFKVSSHFQA